jgi:uncharacterized membrane protein
MAYLISLQYALIVLFAGWTLAYHLILASALPAGSTPVLWLCLSPLLFMAVGLRQGPPPSVGD